MTLGDAPGGPALIAALGDGIKDLSLLFAGTPSAQAEASLRVCVDRIRPKLVKAVGERAAEKILNGFTSAVMGRKGEIESGGTSRA